MNTILVKVMRVPGAVVEVGLNEGATVTDALDAAGISPNSGEAVKLNGMDTTYESTLSDGARVIVAKGAKNA
jgi:hypothetical protein